MKAPIQFHCALAAEKIDVVNAIIRGVSVMTAGEAKGHNLTVDSEMLRSVEACAKARGTCPVRLNHGSGVEGTIGWLENFRQEGGPTPKLLADLHLLASHASTPTVLEAAKRMPRGLGLSASFVSPDDAPPGLARCSELLSVDLVASPAANPTGIFSAGIDDRRPLTAVEKVQRAVAGAGRGAKTGAVTGIAIGALARLRGYRPRNIATTGAVTGAMVGGLNQLRKDNRRDLAARVATVLFREASINRVIDSVESNLPRPEFLGAAETSAAQRIAKKPIVRRIAGRALTIGIGAGAGYYVGKKYGAQAGGLVGAVGGALFSCTGVRNQITLAVAHASSTDFMDTSPDTTARSITSQIDQHAGGQPTGKQESHTLDTLENRLALPREAILGLMRRKILCPIGPVNLKHDDGRYVFASDALNEIRRAGLTAVVEKVIEESDSDTAVTMATGDALREHVGSYGRKPGAKTEFVGIPKSAVHFSSPYRRDEDPSLAQRATTAAKVVGAGALVYGAAGYLRGRAPGLSPFQATQAGVTANNTTIKTVVGRVGGQLRPGASKVADVLANKTKQVADILRRRAA